MKLTAFFICAIILLSKTSYAGVLPEGNIRKILSERLKAISAEKDGIGIVVGVIEPEGRRVRSISLLDLATHTSGLPFMPELSADKKTSADYSENNLYQFIASYKLTRDIGTNWEYSNIGYWLLSEALASRAGKSYEQLLRLRVLTPLKLSNTDFLLSPFMKTKLAAGHDASLQPSPRISTVPVYSLMPAAGGLFSTVNDLLTFLSFAMEYERTPLAAAVALSVKTRRSRLDANKEQALGWNVIGKNGDRLILMDGGTFGYSSCVVWSPVKRVGVAVLSNYAGSVSDIARHLLQPEFPLEHPTATKHTEIKLDSAMLDAYVGRYEAPGEGIFAVVRESDALMIEAPDNWGLPRLRIRPESEQDFFASELPLRVTFQKDAAGRVSGMLVYPPRGQKAVPAQRIDR